MNLDDLRAEWAARDQALAQGPALDRQRLLQTLRQQAERESRRMGWFDIYEWVAGSLALAQMEFDLNIVAALLTLIGYSLNDNIVVYDRIRENLKKYRRMPMPELLDLSVNETLSRTIVTSLSILITLVALLLLGPEVIFGFTLAITFGIFVGTYSSIYMAAPILIWLKVTSSSFVQQESEMDSKSQPWSGPRISTAAGSPPTCCCRAVPPTPP